MIHKLIAFLIKDYKEARSYRISFLMQSVGVVIPLAALFFMVRLFKNVEIDAVDRYGGDYIAFVLVGFVVTSYSATALRSFTHALRAAQASGTLEVLLLTRASLPTILSGWALYPFIRATLFLVAYLLVGFLIVGARFGNADAAAIAVALVLTGLVMASLGILAASFTLVFKQGDPATALVILAGGMLSGVMYPVAILPSWLVFVAQGLPQTHAIEAMRLAALQGKTIFELGPQLGALAVYAALLAPFAIWAFRAAMRQARIDGSLAQF
ncbi:MAG: ABC transporter permease [Chloroflexi bacterium]|nr:ABC transporter permease [Chloroflexota bacterium]